MKKTKLVPVAVLFALALAGLSAQSRIVIGGKAVAMVADAVYLFPGMDSRVVAVAGADQGLGAFLAFLDKGFAAKPTIDKNAGVEVYASLKPDTVILKSSMRRSLEAPFSALGIGQLYLDLETPEDYYKDIATLGIFLGDKTRASALVSFFQNAVDRTAKIAAESGAKAKAKPRVLVVQALGGGQGGWQVPPASWMQTRLVELAGGQPVWTKANPGSGWATVGAEQLAAWNPDVVFVVDYRSDARATATKFASSGLFSSMAAVKAKAVYGFAQDFYSWDQPDTRWILGLEWMARKLYPEFYRGSSIVDSARSFYSFLYGMSQATFNALILPKLAGDLDT